MADPGRSLARLLNRLGSGALALVAMALILLEEWLWDELARAFGVLARLPFWARLERAIAAVPAWAALPLFLVPMTVLFPVKLLALWLMARHQILLGVAVLVLAKVVGTAVAARLFMLLKPTLLTVRWFAAVYDGFIRWRSWVFERVIVMSWWRAVESWRQDFRDWRVRVRDGGIWQRWVRRLRRWRERLKRR